MIRSIRFIWSARQEKGPYAICIQEGPVHTAQSHCMIRSFVHITKTSLYNFYPLKPHFYIIKLGFIEVYIIFLISAQNIDCGYSLEPPRRGGSNENLQSMFWAEIWKISEFLSENFHFLVVKISVYLNGHVFVVVSGQRRPRSDRAKPLAV